MYAGILADALRDVVADKSFSIPSPQSIRVLMVAKSMLEFKDKLKDLESKLTASLNEVIGGAVYTVSGSRKVNRQSLWSSYHSIVVSEDVKKIWAEFIEQPCAILQQYVMQRMINRLLKDQFPATTSHDHFNIVEELSSIELNTLRYVAGYLIRAAMNAIKDSHRSREEEEVLLYGLYEMCTDEAIDDSSTRWVTLLDRGGLIHITQSAFRFFYSLEMEVRAHLNTSNAELMSGSSISTLKDILCKDLDVVYNWGTCHQLLPEKEGRELMNIIVSKFTNLRGHSFASSYMEMYKQTTKKTVQKSKGLRKKLAN